MSLLFHIMSFIDTDGPVGLALLIDKQLSAPILEGDVRQRQPRRLGATAAPKWESAFSNTAPFPPAADISSKRR